MIAATECSPELEAWERALGGAETAGGAASAAAECSPELEAWERALGGAETAEGVDTAEATWSPEIDADDAAAAAPDIEDAAGAVARASERVEAGIAPSWASRPVACS